VQLPKLFIEYQVALDAGIFVADRTVRRWVAGTTDIPPGLYVDLLRLTQKRAKKLDALVSKLSEAAA
jgi:hypothetical protein